jgi:hypothetical protein
MEAAHETRAQVRRNVAPEPMRREAGGGTRRRPDERTLQDCGVSARDTARRTDPRIALGGEGGPEAANPRAGGNSKRACRGFGQDKGGPGQRQNR